MTRESESTAGNGPPPGPARGRWLVRAAYVLPVALLLGAWAAPLALGTRTLYLRDVLNTHLPMKAAHAAALAAGDWLPAVDPYRAGGQPLLGNPNAVPLYPDDVLYAVAPLLWALNAHFWLHLLLAPLALYWLAREWGLERRAACAAGVVYVTCGFTLSTLNFYNLIGATALLPAFVAATLAARRAGDPRRFAALAGGSWGLLLLAGEPVLAALALVAALAARLAQAPLRPGRADAWLAAGIALATAVAAPQWVELLRILPQSLRGFRGYAADAGSVGSLDPRQLVDWLVPFPFGRVDLQQGGAFWGARFYAGKPPLFFSLFPGALAWALVGISGRPGARPAARWAWSVAALGMFLALGAWNPLARPLFRLGVLRYPIKLWLIAAVGLAVLAGIAWERAFCGARTAERSLRRTLAAIAAGLAVLWLAASLAPSMLARLLRAAMPGDLPDAMVEVERLRWSGTLLLLLAAALALVALLRLARGSRAAWVAGLLLGAHAGSQLLLLRPLLGTMDPRRLEPASELLDAVPAAALVVHGDFLDLFGPARLGAGDPPVRDLRDVAGRAAERLYPFAGVPRGRRYELDTSPDGLDSYLALVAGETVKRLPDAARVWLLRSWGVDRLLLGRPLDAAAERLVEPPRVVPVAGGAMYVYAFRDPVPGVRFVGTVVPAADINAALAVLLRPDFDPRRAAVVAGAVGEPVAQSGPGGTVVVREAGSERLVVDVHAGGPGLLVVDRAFLPLYRATVDEGSVEVEAANLYRIGVRVGVGEHRVVLAIDHGPDHHALAGAAVAGLALLVLVALPSRRRTS